MTKSMVATIPDTTGAEAVSSIRNTLGLVPLLALSAAFAGPAHAQQGSIALDGITVEGATDEGSGDGEQSQDSYKVNQLSSPKATAPLLNTPQTVTVIPQQILRERNSQTLVEALKNTPGITFDAGENGFAAGGNQFNIRGFSATGNIFVDGARDNGSYTRDTFNVEQVEVVKGAAADNGRGGAGGYVNLVTKIPHLESVYRANVGVGFDEYNSKSRWRGTADVNQKVNATTAIRLNVMAENGGVAGREIVENNAWGVAPSVAFGLGTNFRTILSYEHVERNDIPDSGVSFNRGGDSIRIPGAGPRVGSNYVPSNGSRDTFFGRRTDFDDIQNDSLLARFEYDISNGVTVSNQTRWAHLDRSARYHIPGDVVPTVSNPYNYDRVNETLTNQTNVLAKVYSGGLKHTFSTGVEFSKEKSDSHHIGRGDNPTFNGSNHIDVDTVAFYAYDTIELNKHWEITGGVRVERFDADVVTTGSGRQIPGLPGQQRFSQSDTTVGGKIGVVYKPVENGSLYASYGLSHLPHGSLLSNPDISRDHDGAFPGLVANADTVELHNYEAGVKWDFFGGRLSTTAAIFQTEKHKVAYLDEADPANPDIVYGKQLVRGIEFGVAGKVTDRWSLFGGLTLMDSERKHGRAVDDAVRGDYSDSGTVAPGFTTVDTTNGDELAFTPNITATLWTTYRWDNGFTLGGGVQYVGESYIGRPDDATRIIPNGKFGKIPDYFLVNLMASYELTDNIKLQLNVDNVFDETYLTTANWNGSWGYLGPSRTFWLSTKLDF